MSDNKKLKKFPILKSDKEAEDFVEDVDLSEYDFSSFKPVKFEFEKKSKRVQLRMPESLLITIKKMAKMRGIPYTRFIREILEDKVGQIKRQS